MKDFEGTEIKVGDEVVQATSASQCKFTRRTVLEVNEKDVLLSAVPQPHSDTTAYWGHPRQRRYSPRNVRVTVPRLLFVIPKQG